jgi:hypothetical protein
MDKDTRNAIERATQRARDLLEKDFAAQLEGVVSTDRGIRSGNQTLTEIMYGSLGYAKDLDLSELEIVLEEKGQLTRFEDEYRRLLFVRYPRPISMNVQACEPAALRRRGKQWRLARQI